MTNVAVALRAIAGVPPVAVTVKGKVPCEVEELTVTLSVELAVAGLELKLQVVPAGRPLTDKVTGSLNPSEGVIVTV